jgi:hypothetical protein
VYFIGRSPLTAGCEYVVKTMVRLKATAKAKAGGREARRYG